MKKLFLLLLAPLPCLAALDAVPLVGGRQTVPFGRAVRVDATSTNLSGTVVLSSLRTFRARESSLDVVTNGHWAATAVATNAVVDWRGTNYTYTVTASNYVADAVVTNVKWTVSDVTATNGIASFSCTNGFGSAEVPAGTYTLGELLLEGTADGGDVFLFLED